MHPQRFSRFIGHGVERKAGCLVTAIGARIGDDKLSECRSACGGTQVTGFPNPMDNK